MSRITEMDINGELFFSFSMDRASQNIEISRFLYQFLRGKTMKKDRD